MKPSEQCKAAGLKNMKELSEMAKLSSETLVNWSKNRPDAFRLLIAGAVSEKRENKPREN